MAHLGMFIMYSMRANMSVALVAMVKTSKIHNQVINRECKSDILKNETKHVRYVLSDTGYNCLQW